jgi:hypothetical protein
MHAGVPPRIHLGDSSLRALIELPMVSPTAPRVRALCAPCIQENERGTLKCKRKVSKKVLLKHLVKS